MLVELQHRCRRQAAGGLGGEEELVDLTITQRAHRDLLGSCGRNPARDEEPKGDGRLGALGLPIADEAHIKELALHLGLQMGHAPLGGLAQARLNQRVVKQPIVTSTDEKAKPQRQEAQEQGQRAVEPIKTEQGVGGADVSGREVGLNGLAGSQQFLSILAIARVGKRTEPFLGVGLEHGGAGAHDFAAFATAIARGTDGVEASTNGREVGRAGECPLAGRLARGIDIKNEQAPALSIQKATELVAGEALLEPVLEEELAERFEAGSIP